MALGLYQANALSYIHLLLDYLVHYFIAKSLLPDSTKRPAQSAEKDRV